MARDIYPEMCEGVCVRDEKQPINQAGIKLLQS